MDYIVIDGVPPWDGRHEFDIATASFTTREWGWIKRHAGYLPLTLEDGFEGGDPELFAVFAAIALRRAGKIENRDVGDVFDRIIDSPFETTIKFEGDPAEPEDDAGPPSPSSNGNTDTSGEHGPTSSEKSAEHPKHIGTHGLAISASDPARSAS